MTAAITLFCYFCGKNQHNISEFTSKNGDTMCKDCWIKEKK